MEEGQERGQKHEKKDHNILSPRHASGRTPCKMNNGLPSKRKVHQPLANLSSSKKGTKKDFTNKIFHGLRGSTVVESSTGRGATLSPRWKKQKVWKPKSPATVLPATRQISNKKYINAVKSASSKCIGHPNRTVHDSKISEEKRGGVENGQDQLQPRKENCICVPGLESFESLNGSTKTLNPNTMYSVDIEKETFSSKSSKSKYIHTDVSLPAQAPISNRVIGSPLEVGRQTASKQIQLCKTSSKYDDERFRSPNSPKPFRLSFHISPVQLASLYSNDSDDGIPHSPTTKNQDDRMMKTTPASDKSNRYFVNKTSRRSFPEIWPRGLRRSNQFSHATPREKRSRLLKSSQSYYTESLDEKISDIETKRNIPFLEFSIISLESKLNQAILELQDRDQKIELLSQQLNEGKGVNGEVQKDTNKPNPSDTTAEKIKKHQNISLPKAHKCEKDIERQSESRRNQSEAAMAHHSLEQTSINSNVSEIKITTRERTEKENEQILLKEQVATQTSTDQIDLHENSYLITEQIVALKQQIRELQHEQKTLQEEIKNAMRKFSSGRCVICKDDLATKVSMESILLPYIKEQVHSSAENLIVNLALSSNGRSAQAINTLLRKVERANAKAESHRIKSEQERYKVANSIKKAIHNLERVKKKIESGSFCMLSCEDNGYRKAADKEKLSQGLYPLHNIESWDHFSRRFRLALEGKLPDPDGISIVDDGRTNRVNSSVQSKAKSLLLELSFERDGSPIGMSEQYNTSPFAINNSELDNNVCLDCNCEEDFVDAIQQMS